MLIKKSTKRAARLTNRVFSQRFLNKIKETYLCNFDFVDPAFHEDADSQLLIPMVSLALAYRGVQVNCDAAAPVTPQGTMIEKFSAVMRPSFDTLTALKLQSSALRRSNCIISYNDSIKNTGLSR